MKMKLAPTLMVLAALVVASIAVPAMAQPDDRGRGHDHRPEGAGRPGQANETGNASEERRGPPAHVRERIEARCDVIENETDRRPPACERLAQIHDGAHQARRAGHALLNAIDALEHRLEKLDALEARFEAKLAQENLSANQTSAWEAKVDRIHAAENQTMESMEAMQSRLDGLKDKWEEVREHARGRAQVAVCHIDEDGAGHSIRISRAAWPAHEAHNDTLGPCPEQSVANDESAIEDDEVEAADEESSETEA